MVYVKSVLKCYTTGELLDGMGVHQRPVKVESWPKDSDKKRLKIKKKSNQQSLNMSQVTRRRRCTIIMQW